MPLTPTIPLYGGTGHGTRVPYTGESFTHGLRHDGVLHHTRYKLYKYRDTDGCCVEVYVADGVALLAGLLSGSVPV